MASGAWGRKTSDAVRAPPSKNQRQSSHGRQNPGSGRGRTNRQRSGGRGSGYNNISNSSSNTNNSSHNKGGGRRNNTGGGSNKPLASLEHVKLLQPGDGGSALEKSVQRITVEMFFSTRLQFLDAPEGWKVPSAAKWTSATRIDEIKASTKAPRMTGDVSRAPRRSSIKETAPPLEECKPLEVNEETRWKSRVFNTGEEQHPDSGSDDEVLRKALLILNKLSLTKFEKLSDDFVATGIGRNANCLSGAIGIIVDKAQSEPHFSTMYARLCYKLSKIPMEEAGGKKAFKKLLLSRCQQEFEEEMPSKIAKAAEGVTEKEERDYQTNIVKKKYLGHMRFIGELYKVDMIKNDIMLWCLKALLQDFEEEKVECFAKLMTTIGYSLEQHSIALLQAGKPSASDDVKELWRIADSLIDGSSGQTASNRIKFMLLDLKELKENGWIKRREEESAKTIDQIHKDVAKEEARQRRNSSRNLGTRRGSSTDIREKAVADGDGFVKVVRSSSMASLKRSVSDSVPSQPPLQSGLRRSATFSVAAKPEKERPEPKAERRLLSLEECEARTKNLLKEYFVGGDTDEAVLSVDEIIAEGHDNAHERGAKVIEAGVLLVLEMKEEHVDKLLTVVLRATQEKKIAKPCFTAGLNDPLEFLRDVEIDAPMAGSLLVKFVAALIDKEILDLSFLLEAPEYFRTEGKAALFAAKVARKLESGVSGKHESVISDLMTDEDKAEFSSVQNLLASVRV